MMAFTCFFPDVALVAAGGSENKVFMLLALLNLPDAPLLPVDYLH